MNLKLNAIILVIGSLIGGGLVYKLTPKPEACPAKLEEKKQIIVKRHIEKKADGSETVDEVEQFLSSRTSTPASSIYLPVYRVSLGLDNAGLGVRLGKLPLWAEGGLNWEHRTIEGRLSYEF